jgi:hypothetical protein
MSTKPCAKLRRLWAEWRRRHRTRDDFPDGSSLSEIHRGGIQYTSPTGSYVVIGYEPTTGGKTVWLIDEKSLAHWDSPEAVEISVNERNAILAKLMQYCEARRRPTRIIA